MLDEAKIRCGSITNELGLLPGALGWKKINFFSFTSLQDICGNKGINSS